MTTTTKPDEPLDLLVQKLIDEVTGMRDEMRVQGAILMRIDGAVVGLMHMQTSRVHERLRKLEEEAKRSGPA